MGDEPLAIDIESADPANGARRGTHDGSAGGDGARRVRCRLCGRPLTGALSRRTGLGPSCDAKLHPPGPEIRTRRHEVEQDTLPGL